MKIEVTVPDGKSGDWSVKTIIVTKQQADFFNVRAAFSFTGGGRRILPGTYKQLCHNGSVFMSNTLSEIEDCVEFIYKAKESEQILINGLGLGVVLTAILESETVKSVTVIEISEDVINLVGPTFADDPRVKIIHADAFTWKPPKGIWYDAVWHDIWMYICEDNLPEMAKLHRKYGRRADWHGSWCKRECQRRR